MFEAKVAIVTDCLSDIGQSTVKLLVQKGYQVPIVGRDTGLVNKLVSECTELSPTKSKPPAFVIDLNNPSNGELIIKQTVQHFGHLDALINNTDAMTQTSPNDMSSYEQYSHTMTVNNDIVVKTTLSAIEHLKKTKGNIIFVSSVASVKPYSNSYAYCMSKAAIGLFAKCLAIDLSPDIRVNIVSPNQMLEARCKELSSSQEAANELISADSLVHQGSHHKDVAHTIMYLISDQATFVNGHEMFVDGGHLIKPSTYNVAQVVRASRNQ